MKLPKFIKLNQRINSLENEVETLELQLHTNIVEEVMKNYKKLQKLESLEQENKVLKERIKKLKNLKKKES